MSQMRKERYDRKVEVRENKSLRVLKMFDPKIEPSKTQQHFKEGQDINNIIGRYDKRSMDKWLRHGGPKFTKEIIDLSEMPDYQQMYQRVINARETFEALPSVIRNRFGNDPHQMIQFLQNPEQNYEEGIRLGLFTPKQKPPTSQEPGTTIPNQNSTTTPPVPPSSTPTS